MRSSSATRQPPNLVMLFVVFLSLSLSLSFFLSFFLTFFVLLSDQVISSFFAERIKASVNSVRDA